MQVFQILERYSGFCFALGTMLGFVAGDLLYAEEPLKTDAVNSRPNIVLIMSDNMDQGIGRILDQLESTGDLDNTLVFFLQDNGGCAEGVGRKDNGSGPGNLQPLGRDGLQPRISAPMQTRDGRWVRTGPEMMPGPDDSYIAYGRGWANVSNTPFREFKHWTHEGGISTPLIVHWPAGIQRTTTNETPTGRLVQEPSHLIDIMTTCVDVAGAEYPRQFNAHDVPPLEGQSLKPLLHPSDLPSGAPPFAKRTLFWEHEGNRAVRRENLKLVATMAAAWDAWAALAKVLPLGTWKKKAAGETRSQPSCRALSDTEISGHSPLLRRMQFDAVGFFKRHAVRANGLG